jgi:hypothetical protein
LRIAALHGKPKPDAHCRVVVRSSSTPSASTPNDGLDLVPHCAKGDEWPPTLLCEADPARDVRSTPHSTKERTTLPSKAASKTFSSLDSVFQIALDSLKSHLQALIQAAMTFADEF